MANVTKKVELALNGLDPADRVELVNDVGEMLLDKIRTDMSAGRSSVSGRAWKKLSPAYAKKVGRKDATLFETGDMDSKLAYRATEDGLEIGWFDSDSSKEADKADGHNNHSGKSALPLRRSIPLENQGFRPGIKNEIEDIEKSYEPLAAEEGDLTQAELEVEETLQLLLETSAAEVAPVAVTGGTEFILNEFIQDFL